MKTYTYKLKNIRVIDGDTIDADIELGFHLTIRERFRLFGIDAPESRTLNLIEKKRGMAAKAWLGARLARAGDKLMIETARHTGKYGRWLGTLFEVDGPDDFVNINMELVAEGHAEFRQY